MAEKQPSPLPKRPSGTAVMQHLLGALSEVLMKVVLSNSWVEFHNCSFSPLASIACWQSNSANKRLHLFSKLFWTISWFVPVASWVRSVLKLGWYAVCALQRSRSEAVLSPLFTFSVSAIKQQCFCCSNEVLQILIHASAPACPGWVVSPQKALCSDPFILCFHTGNFWGCYNLIPGECQLKYSSPIIQPLYYRS